MSQEVGSNNKRVAKNTLYLYLRMLLTLAVGLYTSRIVLQTLGISDFGLYNVVGGIVSMFAFLNGSLSTSTQRYLNFEMGAASKYHLSIVFSTALCIHILIIVIVFILAETIGLWFLLNKLNIEQGRETAALWVYQISIFTSLVEIFQLPFMSTIIAHEKMNIYAYVSIYEVFAKLIIVFLIQFINTDKLILYAALYATAQISVALIYNIYCQIHFNEARLRIKVDKSLFCEMLSFSGWNFFGSLASVCSGQGLNILFNLFFGTVVNAARGIAYQVSGLVNQFANNFQTAAKPQIIKYYSDGKIAEMTQLVYNTSKYSALLLLFLSIPLSIEIDFVLRIWLGEYPDYTPNFLRIILFQAVVTSMTFAVIMVIHATGKLKNVGITAGCANLMILPISYVLLKIGLRPEAALFVGVIFAFLETFIELFWLKYYINFSITGFYRNVYCVVFPLGLLMLVIPLPIRLFVPFHSEVVRFFVVCVVSGITSLCVLYRWGITDQQRGLISVKVHSIFK